MALILIGAFLAFGLVASSRGAAGEGKTEKQDPQGLYSEGIRLFYEGEYAGARKTFQTLILHFPERPETRDAVYKTAESHYREKSWKKAGGYFRFFVERYPLASNTRDAKKRLAQCEAQAGESISAVRPAFRARAVRHLAVMSGSLSFADEARLRRGLAAIASAGFNTLILNGTRQRGVPLHALARGSGVEEGAYFPTGHGPVIRDVVGKVCSVAHGLKMRVLVVLSMRDMSWAARKGEALDRVWNFGKGLQSSPLSDPFAARTLERITRLCVDLAMTPADGIILTDLALTPEEGLSEEAFRAFLQAEGREADPASFFEKPLESGPVARPELKEAYAAYALFKARTVASRVAQIVKAVKAANPVMQVFAELDPMVLADAPEALARRGQDAGELAKTGVDGFLVKCDWRRPPPEFGGKLEEWLQTFKKMSSEAAAINADPKSWIFALPVEDAITGKALPDWELRQAIQNILSAMPAGLALFPDSTIVPYEKILGPIRDRSAFGEED